jgi:hypothetical protein
VKELKKSFPHVVREYQYAKENHRLEKLIKSKFNGDIVSPITNLEGKTLGDFMDFYKHSFKTKQDFDQFILSSAPETIKTSINSAMSRWDHVQAIKV